ncbi:hypothetical protein TWF225_007734 [Orbilia oligospora]|nr:hypothetical protein TWF225_007734 [Orbilia oligospora]KAF3242140.1 hypothetical protein TWF128_010615 [Orbilia oligospora]KAF3251683.1 hypothetical protein TWF217_008012 [Orbilia oligospora]
MASISRTPSPSPSPTFATGLRTGSFSSLQSLSRPGLQHSHSSSSAAANLLLFNPMYLQAPDAPAPASAGPVSITNGETSKFALSQEHRPDQPQLSILNGSAAFPFGTPHDVSKITGQAYLTSQQLVQHVGYSLSDNVFSYSPETFDLDTAAKEWSGKSQANAYGRPTTITSLETRTGAASVLLGYVFSNDRELSKRNIPQTVIASTATLLEMRNALEQLSMLYAVSSPFVAHIAAVDYSPFQYNLVADYTSALQVAQDAGIGLISSRSAHDAQHMALFSTLVSSVLPTVHIYDGVRAGRETAKVVDVLDQAGIYQTYQSILTEQKAIGKKVDAEAKVAKILENLNSELGTSYKLFEYAGHSEPEAVLVVFGSVESSVSAQVATRLAAGGEKIGVISVRVYRPFSETHFLEALPKSVKRVAVLGQVIDQAAVDDASVQSSLYADVLAALTMAEDWTITPPVIDVKYPREQGWVPSDFAWIFDQIVKQKSTSISPPEEALAAEASHIAGFEIFEAEAVSQYVFWDLDVSTGEEAPSSITRLLASDSSRNVTYSSIYDNLSQAGITYSWIRSAKETVQAHYDVTQADVVVVNDSKITLSYDVASGVKASGTLLLRSPIKDEDLEAKLPAQLKKALAHKKAKFYILDVPQDAGLSPEKENLLLQLAFLRISGEVDKVSAISEKLANIDKGVEPQTIQEVAALIDTYVREVPVPESWLETEVVGEPLPSSFDPNSFAINTAKSEEDPKYLLKKSIHSAIILSFREAFELQNALRPDLPVTNFIVRVQENKRLTPLSYDRNIFHIEFDLTGTGMTYDIGEALGIHAHNDPEEVNQFIQFYGLEANDVVEVPSRDDPDQLEMRTIYQALSQNIDIFGRPPKKFYEALSEFATDEKEKKELLTLGSAEGAVEFKRRAEVDTVTYADVLLEFGSAHPSFHDLAKIVSPMKRREYSIASSQQVHPNSVHLLIVVVNWVDPKGRDRFGQATRYLSGLKIGSEVTVSVKPSVMKLPTESTKPLIMAGLGTGLAPFRAFVQYRAWQKEQGIPIGSVLLYMGSRHQREEYLYGEEWEAYEAAGVVTYIGKAFSRDQPEKVYIQDRMRQSLEKIVKAYGEEEAGSFYLCGPTWPVPDVQEVLMEAIAVEATRKGVKVDTRRRIEELKDDGRYVLEVY